MEREGVRGGQPPAGDGCWRPACGARLLVAATTGGGGGGLVL